MRRALLLVPFLLLLGGCVVGAPEIAAELDVVCTDLAPRDVETEVELHFGRGMLGFASTMARWSDEPDAHFASDLLDGVESVQIGSYLLHGRRADDLTPIARTELRDLGWRFVVRTRSGGDEAAWVLARDDGDRTAMLVVAIDRDELTLVRIDGQPERLLAAAIRRDEQFAAATTQVRAEF